MDVFDRKLWDVNASNGIEAFFTPEAFEKYSVTLDFEQKLLRQKRLLCETTQTLASECSPANQREELNSKQKEIATNVASGSTSDNDKKLKLSKQSGKQDKFYQPKYWNIKFPHISTLTQTEQSQYAQYFQKYSVTVPSQPTPTEAKEIQLLRELHVKVSAEQNEFLLWLANVSAPQSVEDYEYISPKAQRCIEAMLRTRMKDVQQYPRYYVQCDTVDLRPPKDVAIATFTCLEELAQLGELSQTSLPVIVGVAQNVHLTATAGNSTRSQRHFQMSASRDSLMAELATRHGASVTLTSSSWKRLVDNVAPQFGAQWELAVVVREEIDADGARHKVVYIDKPFAWKVWSIRERMSWYYQRSFRQWLSRSLQQSSNPKRKTKKAKKRARKFEDRSLPKTALDKTMFDPQLVRVDLASFETFGAGAVSRKANNRGRGLIGQRGRGSGMIDKRRPDDADSCSDGSSSSSSGDEGSSDCSSNLEDEGQGQVADSVPQVDGAFDKRGRGRGNGRGKGRGSRTAAAAAATTTTATVPTPQTRKSPRRLPTSSGEAAECDEVIQKTRRVSRVSNVVVTTTPSDITAPTITRTSCTEAKDAELKREEGSNANAGGCCGNDSESDSELVIATASEEGGSERVIAIVSQLPSPVVAGEVTVIALSNVDPSITDGCGDSTTDAVSMDCSEIRIEPESSDNKNSALQMTGALPISPAAVLVQDAVDNNVVAAVTSPDANTQQQVGRSPVTPVQQHTCRHCPPVDRRVTYDLFALNDLRFVIRHSDAFSAENPDGLLTPIYPVAKVEYQLKYGVEQMTASEVAQNWASLSIRRNCRLARARVNAFNGKVIMSENLAAEQLVPQRGLFQVNVAMQSVYSILKKLCQLPLGHYLLSHNSGSPAVHIKRATDASSGVYDLHLAHSQAPAAKCATLPNIPWVPIDTTIMLPFHLVNGRIPATFSPKGHNDGKLQSQGQSHGKKRNKKGKIFKNFKRNSK